MTLSYDDYELYLDYVYGAMVIDMDGNVVYMNDQCARYLNVDKDASIGRHALDVFPSTKMIEGLSCDKPRIVFYNSYAGLGISIQAPIFKDENKVGLIEYDVIQGSEFLYDFADKYRLFLDGEFKFLPHQITHLADNKYTINNIVGNSAGMRRLREQIAQAAHGSSTVLITGETGTGKELVAHAIHNLSSRRKHPFVRINAASLPASLIESELFGYEPGAFTGATKEGKRGKFEQANKGTLFLDEINQMPVALQPKLLRAIQEKEIDRLGGTKSIPLDIRIITASNRDLHALIKEGTFREDLFYRLNVVEIRTPSLRDIPEDIPHLTDSILRELNLVMGKKVTNVDPAVLEMFRSYDWPGNVRELQNVIERAMNYVEGDTLLPEFFEFKQIFFDKLVNRFGLLESDSPIEIVKNAAERSLILKVLAECGNNKSQAARILKISRPLLYKKMRRLEIEG
jgi:transcriptional regulator with PAS, ATPase and Fis domain